jgi:Mg/Co/Ni transporter MgtE
MSNMGVLIPILGIMCGLVAIIANAVLRSQKMKIELMREQRVSSVSEEETMREIARLKERVAVLEKLVTDDDRRLAGDIDRLRRDDDLRR